jgi:hypothetical protein
MSHTVTVKVELKDHTILEKACKKVGAKFKTGRHKIRLYDGSIDVDASIELQGWRYPIGLTSDGEAKMDNFSGNWGDINQFDRLQQEYAAEVTLQEAANMGYLSSQEMLPDGTIKIELYR